MWVDIGVFGASACVGLLLSLGAYRFWSNEPTLLADESDWEFEKPPVPLWKRVMADAFPQLPVERQRIQRDLLRAGYYGPDAIETLLAWRNTLLWAVILLTVLVSSSLPGIAAITVIAGAVIGGLVYSLPGLYLNLCGQSRVQQILDSVPDTLDVMSMCLSGGLTVEQSLAHVASYSEETHPEFSKELTIVSQQAVASTPSQAFHRMADRLDEGELRSLAAIVEQSERLGTSLGTAIDQLAVSIRKSARQRAEARANSMALKLLFPVIFCVTPPVFFILVVPPIVKIRDHFLHDHFEMEDTEAVRAMVSAFDEQ